MEDVLFTEEGGERRRPVDFRLGSIFFSGYKESLQQLVFDFFGSLVGGGEQINCKIVHDILKKPSGFHTTAREPKRAQLAPTLQTPPKFHEKTPRERKRAKMVGEGKKGEILGGPAEGGFAEGV